MSRSLHRTAAAAAAVLGLALAALSPATVASAVEDPALQVPFDKTFVFKGAPITGVSTVYYPERQVPAETVADCKAEPAGCHVIPLRLQIPEKTPKAIAARGYILTVKFEWDTGQRVENLPAVGSAYANQLLADLWQDPPIIDSTEAPAFTATSNGNEPSNLVAVSPTSSKFDLVVLNEYGANNGYTLTISLSDAASIAFDGSRFAKPVVSKPYVQPKTFSPAAPPQAFGFGGATSPAFPTTFTPGGVAEAVPALAPAAGGPAPIVVPDVADGSADTSLLAAGRLNIRSGLGLRAVNASSVISSTKAKESGTASIVAGLLALPLLASAGLSTLLLRRRRGRGVPTS